MRIAQLLAAKNTSRIMNPGVVIAFLGDSVTQGCFELYHTVDGELGVVMEPEHSYPSYVGQILNRLYPKAAPTILNAGASGDTAPGGLARVERDVTRHAPDLTVVSFGLNDCTAGEEGITAYVEALAGIFDALEAAGSEVIFLTENALCTYVSPREHDPALRETCAASAELQVGGVPERYFAAARELCAARGIPVCDCHALWQGMASAGVDVTELLANRCNHPAREMNWLFAMELVKTMLLA